MPPASDPKPLTANEEKLTAKWVREQISALDARVKAMEEKLNAAIEEDSEEDDFLR